jgi:hypothetical protein
MRMCLNRKVLIGLGAVAAIVLIVAPGAFVATLPVLLVLACPLSMAVMMWGLSGHRSARGQDAGGSCHRSEADAALPGGDRSELVRLRAEIDQLRATLRDRQGQHSRTS